MTLLRAPETALFGYQKISKFSKSVPSHSYFEPIIVSKKNLRLSTQVSNYWFLYNCFYFAQAAEIFLEVQFSGISQWKVQKHKSQSKVQVWVLEDKYALKRLQGTWLQNLFWWLKKHRFVWGLKFFHRHFWGFSLVKRSKTENVNLELPLHFQGL